MGVHSVRKTDLTLGTCYACTFCTTDRLDLGYLLRLYILYDRQTDRLDLGYFLWLYILYNTPPSHARTHLTFGRAMVVQDVPSYAE